ncbi:MAG: DegV family protein [Dehalococcoidia bacterium]
MGRVGIVTDSTACIPSELVARYAIEVIPVYLVFQDRQYQDGMTERAAEFYETLRSAPEPPTTAAPSPGVYAEAMLRAARDAGAVICITVSRQFSAMHDAAVQGAALAREQAPRLDIRVLDSGAAAMAQGFVVLEAARAAQSGADVEGVVARAQAVMPNVQLLVALDTLAYLGRSGRVPRLIVWAASPLQVKPIVVFHKGAYRPLAIVRTMRRAVDRLYQALEQRARPGALHVCVHHTNVQAQAGELAERVRSALQPRELYVQEFTQVMGVHTGPGVLGFAFHNEV